MTGGAAGGIPGGEPGAEAFISASRVRAALARRDFEFVRLDELFAASRFYAEMMLRVGVGLFYDLGYGAIDGAFNSAPYSNVLTEDVHPPLLALREVLDGGPEEPSFESVTLAGPTCDSADVVAHDYPMPPLSVGDIVGSPMMGAYTSVTSSRFNGIAATPIVLA